MSKARNHHYISKFYFSGFTKSGGSKAKIHVYDKLDKKKFTTIARNIAAKRDFNRVDIKNNENIIETLLSDFESKASKAFRNIGKTHNLSNADDFSLLMNFICMLAIRNPAEREIFGDFQKQIAQNVAQLSVSNKEIYDSQMTNMEKDTGKKCTVSYEKTKSFVNEKRYTINVPNHSSVVTELSVFDDVLPYFSKRLWTLIVSDQETGEFVTCDRPVTIIPTKDSINTRLGLGLGFGLKNTEVSFPINRYLAIIGRFEDVLPPKMKATKRMVAEINGRSVNHSMRQIFSSHKNFYYMDFDGEIKKSKSIIN